MRHATRLALALVSALVAAAPAVAQTSDGFYKNKTVHLVLSTGVAGGYALYGRLLARHMADHLPGKPNIIVENMPGAGGVKAANWLYAQAPRDGTTIGLVQVTVPFAPLMGNQGATYDATKFNWIGSMDQAPGICMAWHEAPIKTWDDMRSQEFVVGGTGVGSSMLIYPALMNLLLGTKFKVIAGYGDGASVYLAMQRHEVMGACGAFLTTIKATLPEWITGRKFNVPIVIAPHRLAEYPDTPAIAEFIKDEHTRQVFELTFATGEMDRPVLAPPGVPQERVDELRAAFLATMRDPVFRQEAERSRLSIEYLGGEQLADTIKRSYALPASAIETARKAMSVRP